MGGGRQGEKWEGEGTRKGRAQFPAYLVGVNLINFDLSVKFDRNTFAFNCLTYNLTLALFVGLAEARILSR